MPNLADAYFLDCGLTYSGSPSALFVGLDHLEGEVVKVIADGKVHPDCTVASGSITLNYEASVVHVGFGFTAKMKTLPIEQNVEDGASQGRLKEIPAVIVLINESVGMLVGPDENNLDTVMFTEGETWEDVQTIFSGAIDVNIESGHERQARVVIHQSEALPLTINAINFDYELTQK